MSKSAVSGNVLFLILIAVALFAALSYAITGSSRSGGDTISKDKANIMASRIIQFGTQLEQAVTKTRLLGTPEHGMDFSTTGYAHNLNNANSTCADDSCKIYHINGGGAVPIEDLDVEYRDSNHLDKFNIRVGFGTVLDVGSDLPEVILIMHGISREICDNINIKLNNIGAVTEAFGGALAKYEGALTALPDTSPVTYGDNQVRYKGKYSFCALHSTGGNYYAHVLIAR